MLQEDIDNTLFKLKSVEERTKEAETQQEASRAEYSKELNKAKKVKDMIQMAFKRAQERVSDFEIQPDDELAAEMKQLDDDEQAIINDADIERDDIIGRECISPRVD
jgi:Na+-translocating ferredoxin:NAD+ oxidoreductase RnfC subunit